jgi:phosphatidylinositol alpha-mannosyltransferase
VFRNLSRVLLPRFEAVLIPSDAPRGHLVAGPGQTIRAFPPCTDLRVFRDALPQPGFADGRVNILFLGRLEPRKGALLLLEAFRLLCEESGPAARLIIAGSGAQEAALKAYARKNDLSAVVFAGAPADAAPWFAAADIFCAPSPHGESFGIVIAEAMASGKPVVAAANPGYRTLLTGAAAQFLVTPGDARALARALAVLAGDAGLRRRLGAWGRQAALDHDCRALAPALEAIFRDAILAHRLKARSAT